MLRVKYNGRKYPRTVSIKGGRHISFSGDRQEIELNDYDAYLLLKANTRLTPERWEFNVVEVSDRQAKEPERPIIKEPTKLQPPVREVIVGKEGEGVIVIEKSKTKQAMNAGIIRKLGKSKKREA